LLQQARQQTYKTVNAIMTRNNWLIGCRIVLQEQKGEKRAEYGSHLIEGLAKNLAPEFGEASRWLSYGTTDSFTSHSKIHRFSTRRVEN
jgi:hypothetical protein